MCKSWLNLQKCIPFCYEFWLLLFNILFDLCILIFFLCLSSIFVYLCSTLCIPCFCIFFVYCFFFVYSCLFLIFVQAYRPLPPGGNSIVINKYLIINFNYYWLSKIKWKWESPVPTCLIWTVFPPQVLHSKKCYIVTFCSTRQSSRILKMRKVFSSILYFLLDFSFVQKSNNKIRSQGLEGINWSQT